MSHWSSSVIVGYSQSSQSEDTWIHLYEKFLCIRTYWKYTQVLFSKLICTASIKSSRIVRYSDTNNIQSSHHRQTGIRSQRLERFHQSLRSSAYWRSRLPGKNVVATMTDLPLFDELCDNADEQLYDTVRRNSHHTFHYPPPPESLASQNYSLRSRAHNRQLPEHFNHLDNSNFIICMLYKNMY